MTTPDPRPKTTESPNPRSADLDTMAAVRYLLEVSAPDGLEVFGDPASYQDTSRRGVLLGAACGAQWRVQKGEGPPQGGGGSLVFVALSFAKSWQAQLLATRKKSGQTIDHEVNPCCADPCCWCPCHSWSWCGAIDLEARAGLSESNQKQTC